MNTDLIEQSAPTPAAPCQSILFALSAEDCERFLPGRNLKQEFDAQAQYVDVSRIESKKWERLLFDTNPEILITGWGTPPLPESFARQLNLSLRYICHLAGGVHGHIPRAFLERGVLVSNWGTTISHTIAEQALLLTLGALRNLPQWGSFMHMPSRRVSQMRIKSLRGKRVGLHGFGAVAREIVQMLRPFRVEIFSYSAGVPGELFESHGVRQCKALEELFSCSDILIECEALTLASRGSVTGAILDLLPEDGAFINVGRGAVVDEQALVQRAARGRIRVAIDVFAEEPPPPRAGLLRIPNALLSPHIAGPTSDTLSHCGDFAMSNLRRYLQGQQVQGLISLEKYDRLM